MNQTADLLLAYSRDPLAKYVMEDFSISMEQANSVCGDSLTVYVKISPDMEKSPLTPLSQEGNTLSVEKKESFIIQEWSREGKTEMQTTAAASMLGEVIE